MHWPLAVHGRPVGFGEFVHTLLASQNRGCCASEAHVPGSSFPVATGAHVPLLEFRLHTLQVSVHAVLQHTPSAQLPLAQSENVWHAKPIFALHCWAASHA